MFCCSCFRVTLSMHTKNLSAALCPRARRTTEQRRKITAAKEHKKEYCIEIIQFPSEIIFIFVRFVQHFLRSLSLAPPSLRRLPFITVSCRVLPLPAPDRSNYSKYAGAGLWNCDFSAISAECTLTFSASIYLFLFHFALFLPPLRRPRPRMRPAADAVIPLRSPSSIFIIMDLHGAEKSITAVLIGMSGARGRPSASRTALRRSSSSPARRAAKLSLELRINLHFFSSNRHRLRSARIAGATMGRVAK